jgi:hypothetical protein
MDIFLPCERLIFFETGASSEPARQPEGHPTWRSRTNAHTYRLLIVKEPDPHRSAWPAQHRFRHRLRRAAFAVGRDQQRNEIMKTSH